MLEAVPADARPLKQRYAVRHGTMASKVCTYKDTPEAAAATAAFAQQLGMRPSAFVRLCTHIVPVLVGHDFLQASQLTEWHAVERQGDEMRTAPER